MKEETTIETRKEESGDICFFRYTEPGCGAWTESGLFITKNHEVLLISKTVSGSKILDSHRKKLSLSEAFSILIDCWMDAVACAVDTMPGNYSGCIPDTYLEIYFHLIIAAIHACNCENDKIVESSEQIKDWADTRMIEWQEKKPYIKSLFNEDELNTFVKIIFKRIQDKRRSSSWKNNEEFAQKIFSDDEIMPDTEDLCLFQVTERNWFGKVETGYYMKQDESCYKVSRLYMPGGSLKDIRVLYCSYLETVTEVVGKMPFYLLFPQERPPFGTKVNIINPYLALCYRFVIDGICDFGDFKINYNPGIDSEEYFDDMIKSHDHIIIDERFAPIRKRVYEKMETISERKNGPKPPFGYYKFAMFMDAVIRKEGFRLIGPCGVQPLFLKI